MNSARSTAKALSTPALTGTIAALAIRLPSTELSIETAGMASLAGQSFSHPRVRCGTTVAFREYAAALAGTPQTLVPIGKFRQPLSVGPPSAPIGLRVSTSRQGVN